MLILKSLFIPYSESHDRALIIIKKKQTSYVIERINAGRGVGFNIDCRDIDPWGRAVYYWNYGKGFIRGEGFDDGDRDYDGFMRSLSCPEGPIIIAARGGNDELVLIVNQPMFTELPFTQYREFGSSDQAIEMVIPGYTQSAKAVARRAKIQLLKQINPVAILAEQEKQIDLLSLLVLTLAERQPEEEQPDWLPQFKAMMAQDSSLQFKGVNLALQDVAREKAKLRALQQQYFKARAGET